MFFNCNAGFSINLKDNTAINKVIRNTDTIYVKTLNLSSPKYINVCETGNAQRYIP